MTPITDRKARELAQRLILASARLFRRLRASGNEAKLSGPEASALAVVVHSGGVSLGELAVADRVSFSAISKVAKQLEEAGLVVRTTNSGDRRVKRLSATSTGKAWVAQGRGRHIMPLAAVVRGLSAEDARTLEAALPVLERLCALVQNK